MAKDRKFAALADAVYAKDLAKVKTLAGKVKADVRRYNANGDTLLAFAVSEGTPLAILKLLVEAGGASLDAANPEGDTPISYAVLHERVDVIEYFKSRGAKIKHVPFAKLPQGEKNRRLARTVEDWWSDDCAKRLRPILDGGANPDARIDGVTALERLAVQSDDARLHALLLAAGANPALPDKAGSTPIHSAAQYAHGKVVRLLLDAGVPIDLRDRAGNTPLHRCAMSGHNGCDEVAKLLVKRGADPLLRNKAGETAIDVAMSDIKAMLVKHTAKPIAASARSLLAAVAGDDAKAVARLLAAAADPCAVDASGKSWGSSSLDGVAALHLAFGRGVGRPIQDALLGHGKLDINVRAVDGRTPLHYLMQYGMGADRIALVERMIALGADVNAANDRRATPIFQAISIYELDGELQLIDLLVAAGAKRDHKNAHDHTVLDEMFDRTRRFDEVHDKAGFARIFVHLVERKFPTRHSKEAKAWIAKTSAKHTWTPR